MPHVELPQAEFKVVMLGDSFTGKTSLVLRFAEGHYRESARNSTVGAFFITKRLSVNGITCKIQIWDTAGHEKFKALAPMYYKNAAAAIVCYDVTSTKSYKTLKYWLEELHKNVAAGSIVIAMAATKTDLDAVVSTEEAKELAQTMGAVFVETSAKRNVNVTELFHLVAERVLRFQKAQQIPVRVGGAAMEDAVVERRDSIDSKKQQQQQSPLPQQTPIQEEEQLVNGGGNHSSSKNDRRVISMCDGSQIMMCGTNQEGNACTIL